MNVNDYILKKERKEFDYDEKTKLFQKVQEQRREWNNKAAIGLLIYNGEYLRNRKLADDTSTQSEFYSINSVKDNLMLTINEALIPEINVSLVNKRNNILPLQDILDLELNYIIDKDRIVRDIKQILISTKFMGFGCSRVYWDSEDNDTDWWTGKPKNKPIDPRKIWYVSVDNREDKSDIVEIFHREQYTLDEFKKKYPKYYEQYQKKIVVTPIDELENDYYHQMGIVNVIINQYKKKFTLKERAIANEEPDSMDMIFVSESEYEEYLAEKGANTKNMDMFKKTGEIMEDTPVFDEYMRASIPIDKVETRWFQSIFIPELDILLEEPELVGEKSDYVILPGEWNPDDIYPTPIAYDYKELLKISGILLTTMVLNTVKLQKPIPIIVEGALKNESHFLKNYHKLGVIARVDSVWAKQNPGVSPVKWLAPPSSGQMQAMLYQMIDKLLDKSMSTPEVSRGIPSYAGQSGKQTELLQNKAQVSNKPDYFAVEELLRKIAEKIKDLIAERRTYPHQIFLSSNDHVEGLTTIKGNQALAEVNTDVNNKLSEIADKCYVRVSIDSSVESKNQIKDINYKELFMTQNITFEEFVNNQSWITNPEQLVESHKSATSVNAIAELINNNPQLKEQVMEMMQQNEAMEAEQPNNVKQEVVK